MTSILRNIRLQKIKISKYFGESLDVGNWKALEILTLKEMCAFIVP